MRLQANDLSLTLKGRRVLDGINLSMGPGKMIGLIGPNGAGKSSLLSVLAGLRSPEKGTVTYDGRTRSVQGRQELSRRLAYLAQSAPVEWALSVPQVVALGRLPHRGLLGPLDATRDAAAITSALAITEVTALSTRPLRSLSGGERMRVLLARALAVEGEVVLADEPTAGLDPYHQLQVMELLEDTAKRGAGVLVVLHDLTLAARFCRRILLMQEGRLVADGPPDEVLTEASLRQVYSVIPLIGHAHNERFVVPWRRSTRP